MAVRRLQRIQHGAALLIFLVLLVMGGLSYVVSSFSPESIEARRAQTTHIALVQAREALIGYALKYRDAQAAKDADSSGEDDRAMYGYLPLPDLGSSRNQNLDPACRDASNNPLEGCDANTFTGLTFDANGIGPTVVGRFPWRTLGTGPLRDGHGECLWLIVSSLHNRIQRSSPAPLLPPMNWDTLGQLDVVVANGTNALVSALASAHERPIAVIFAPGPPLPGQNRNPSATDDVGQCGGNYSVANYLDPATASALGGVTNYLAGANLASGTTGDSVPANDPDTPKSLLTRGKIFATGSSLLPGGCQGSNCNLVANDIGLPVTSDYLFGTIRKNIHFRTDINSMLDRMTSCLRDQIAAGSSFTPAPITGYTAPADKSAGRIQSSICYDDDLNPLGYFSHYREMIFVAKPTAGNFTVAGDPNCAGVLLFSGQRNATQQRITATQKNTPANYLEGNNLASFTGVGTTFSGDLLLDRSPPQAVEQDIARCIPVGGSFAPVVSPTLTTQGFGQLSSYQPATRTLTLGQLGVTTGAGATAAALFGCSWNAETRALGGGVRIYYRFNIIDGGDGYVFALIDGNRNGSNVCGAARQHLGYSGDNATTPYINWPKIAIEFDTRGELNAYSETGDLLGNGRSDPCYRTACGNPTQNMDYDSHVAITYWGNPATVAGVALPRQDDNVHGFPTPPDASTRPAPRNPIVDPWPNPAVPATPGGVASLNRLSDTSLPRNFHVRIELTPLSVNVANRSTTYKIQAWVVAESVTVANQIAAMKITSRPMSAQYPPLVQDSPTIYDIPGGLCSAGCSTSEVCNSTDGICYQPALRTVRAGFTTAQSTRDQRIMITDFSATWLP